MDLTITLDKSSVQMLFKISQKLDQKGLFKLLLGLFGKIATKAAGFVTQTQLSSQVLKRRTGSLARSMTGMSMMERGMPSFRIGVFRGPSTLYAGALEHGALILPRTAKSLAMPVDAALTPAGVDRYGGPRNYPGRLTFIPFRSSGVAIGALYDAASLKRLKGGAIDWGTARRMYVLLKQAKIPAFHYLRNGLRNYLPYVAAELSAFLKQWLVEALHAPK